MAVSVMAMMLGWGEEEGGDDDGDDGDGDGDDVRLGRGGGWYGGG